MRKRLQGRDLKFQGGTYSIVIILYKSANVIYTRTL